MQSHSWLLIVTVAAYATVIYANAIDDKPQMPKADDPQFNKMLPEENKSAFTSRIPKIPLADDPR